MYGDWEGSRIGSLHSFEKSVIKSYPYKDFRLFRLLCLLSSLEHAQRSSVYLYGDLNMLLAYLCVHTFWHRRSVWLMYAQAGTYPATDRLGV